MDFVQAVTTPPLPVSRLNPIPPQANTSASCPFFLLLLHTHHNFFFHLTLCLDQISLNRLFSSSSFIPSHKLSRRSTHPALHPTSHVIHHPFLMSFLFLSETPLSHPPRLVLAAHSPPIRRFIIKPLTLSSESSHPQNPRASDNPLVGNIITPPFSAS